MRLTKKIVFLILLICIIFSPLFLNHGEIITPDESYKEDSHPIIRISKKGGPFNEYKASIAAD